MMTDPNGIFRRIGVPVLDTRFEHSTEAQAQSTSTAPKSDVQRLRDLRTPPLNHADFEFPTLGGVDKAASLAEFDARAGFKSPAERRCLSLAVTREAVLAFMNDGIYPNALDELQALAIFLIKNKLPDALSWLGVQADIPTLDLSECELRNEEAGLIADWAKTTPFEIRLAMGSNGITADGAALLSNALLVNNITHLDLSFNFLGDSGVQALAAGLSSNTSLRSLNLDAVDMQNAGIEAIVGVLDTHPALESLVLNHGEFDDQGAAALAAALGRNKRLSHLSIVECGFSVVGLTCLANALGRNTGLKSLEIGNGGEDDASFVHALADALVGNQTLTDLSVFANFMPDAASSRLAAAVAVNTTLKSFKFISTIEPSKVNAAIVSQITEKVRANALIAEAGLAVSKMSGTIGSAVPLPPEVGYQIAAFAAQVSADGRREEALNSLLEAGLPGAMGQENDTELKTSDK
jgi:hypothetical protein